mmetsp:Transcript_24358/g.39189  ORF Transcript_24358/g.39189 Transcript_24358/m.39189 type:complete len:225 (+) Transcript_24358:1494-2168(+)
MAFVVTWNGTVSWPLRTCRTAALMTAIGTLLVDVLVGRSMAPTTAAAAAAFTVCRSPTLPLPTRERPRETLYGLYELYTAGAVHGGALTISTTVFIRVGCTCAIPVTLPEAAAAAAVVASFAATVFRETSRAKSADPDSMEDVDPLRVKKSEEKSWKATEVDSGPSPERSSTSLDAVTLPSGLSTARLLSSEFARCSIAPTLRFLKGVETFRAFFTSVQRAFFA